MDRCKPTFAVHLLEQIKHYIFDDRITFVFSVNLEQLQHTIKHYYGAEFDSCRYLDRFFDLRIAMPPANIDKFYNEIGLSSTHHIHTITKRIIKMCNFQMREITRFYAQVKAAVYEPTCDSNKHDFSFSEGKGNLIVLMYIVPLMIGLQLSDTSKYENFINGRDSGPLKELLNMDEESYLLESMLNNDETFEKQDGKTIVTPNDIIERLYEAIFVNLYEGSKYSTTLGKYTFSRDTKTMAIATASMMSSYTDLSI